MPPSTTSPDFRALVRRNLPALRGGGAREADVVEELAQLLEDAWADRPPAEAPDPADAVAVAGWIRREIPRWDRLASALGPAVPEPSSRPSPHPPTLRRRLVTGWIHDLRGALRQLRKSPVFTAVAVTTLALGIGLNSAVFSLVESILFRPAPVAAADELVRVYSSMPDGFFPQEPMALPDLVDVEERTDVFESVAGFAMTQMALQVDGEAELVVGEMVTGSFFGTLGLVPRLGRLFDESDDRRGSPAPVVVLAHRTWQRRFGGDPDVLGRELLVNGRRVTVVGVMSDSFRGLFPALVPELWIPLHLAVDLGATAMQGSGSSIEGVHIADNRSRRWLWSVGRLADGVSAEQAETALSALGQALAREHPDSNEDRELTLLPFEAVAFIPGAVDQGIRVASSVLMGLVALVLLISSANLASMLLARASRRRREIATRLALGASRARLVRQLFVESLVLALVGGTVGLLVGWAGARMMAGFRPPSVLPMEVATQLNWRVALFTFALSALAALVFGLAPAFEATRTDLAATLREESGSTTGSRRRRRLQSLLVVGQVALSTVLLVCATLSVRSAYNAQRVDPGLDPRGVVTAALDPALQGWEDERVAPFYERLREELVARPGVESVAYASHLPLTLYVNTWEAIPEGQEHLPEREWPSVDVARVDGEYFRTLRIPLLAGRAFERSELEEGRRVVVVNEELARRFWPGESALGRRLRFSPTDEPYEVVGVAADGKYRTLGESPRPFVYTALSPRTTARFVVARFRGDDGAVSGVETLRRTVRSLDEQLAISSLSSLDAAMSPSLALPRLSAALFGAFGLLGLLIAAIGLYGVLAYSVSQRTQEIGIRVAMGAAGRDVVRLVLRQGLLLTASGLVAGLAAAFAVTQALGAILYGVGPHDLLTFATVAVALLTLTVMACLLPARRAVRIDPLTALRYS